MAQARDADYYNKRIATLKGVHDSEAERIKHLQRAVQLSREEVEEFMKRHEENERERERQHDHVRKLEESVRGREEQIAQLKKKITLTRTEIQEKDVSIQTLRQQVKRVQMRAKTAEEMQKLRRDASGDADKRSRQLALLQALKYINDRIKQLEGEQLGQVHKELDEQDQKTVMQRMANRTLREENDKTKMSIEEEMKEQQRYVEEIAMKIEQTRKEIAQLDAQAKELENAPQSIAMSTETLEGVIQQLKDQIAQTERDRAAIEEEKKTLVQRIMRSNDPDAKMRECMMLLKSAVINLWKDYQSIGQVREKIMRRPDQEAVFKEAHNTLKTALRIKEERDTKKWRVEDRGRWVDLTEQDIEGHLARTKGKGETDYRTRTIFKALQEMVIAWDVMPEEKKEKMVTCEEVVANALLLYALARYALAEQNKVLMGKKAKLDLWEKGRPGSQRARGQSPSQSPQRKAASPPASRRAQPARRGQQGVQDAQLSPPRPGGHADPASDTPQSFL
eukprot:TRINITY_DN12908_c0_g1_i1.p1 TRINITY_DN12908_c0_g1~~TRINITY_DN12908_c0_g1_i1.p1  ORF type:complete len:507 (+),score=247.18 TRINITY_DN12908_c0_g1_i1:95-1615(+)